MQKRYKDHPIPIVPSSSSSSSSSYDISEPQPQQFADDREERGGDDHAEGEEGEAQPEDLHLAAAPDLARRQKDIDDNHGQIYYSPRYADDENEYRHVALPKQIGEQQSIGWEHYAIHLPEPHILLFRREKDYQLKYPNGKQEPKVDSMVAEDERVQEDVLFVPEEPLRDLGGNVGGLVG